MISKIPRLGFPVDKKRFWGMKRKIFPNPISSYSSSPPCPTPPPFPNPPFIIFPFSLSLSSRYLLYSVLPCHIIREEARMQEIRKNDSFTIKVDLADAVVKYSAGDNQFPRWPLQAVRQYVPGCKQTNLRKNDLRWWMNTYLISLFTCNCQDSSISWSIHPFTSFDVVYDSASFDSYVSHETCKFKLAFYLKVYSFLNNMFPRFVNECLRDFCSRKYLFKFYFKTFRVLPPWCSKVHIIMRPSIFHETSVWQCLWKNFIAINQILTSISWFFETEWLQRVPNANPYFNSAVGENNSFFDMDSKSIVIISAWGK